MYIWPSPGLPLETCCISTSALGQDFIADCNIIKCSLLRQCVRSCVLCVQVATHLIYMIVVPRPAVNDVTAISLCQSYYEKVYPVDNYSFVLYNTNLISKNNFKDCRRLCSYISLYLNTRNLSKIAKLGHGRCFLQSSLR